MFQHIFNNNKEKDIFFGLSKATYLTEILLSIFFLKYFYD